jgi:hypothetical protein
VCLNKGTRSGGQRPASGCIVQQGHDCIGKGTRIVVVHKN